MPPSSRIPVINTSMGLSPPTTSLPPESLAKGPVPVVINLGSFRSPVRTM